MPATHSTATRPCCLRSRTPRSSRHCIPPTWLAASVRRTTSEGGGRASHSDHSTGRRARPPASRRVCCPAAPRAPRAAGRRQSGRSRLIANATWCRRSLVPMLSCRSSPGGRRQSFGRPLAPTWERSPASANPAKALQQLSAGAARARRGYRCRRSYSAGPPRSGLAKLAAWTCQSKRSTAQSAAARATPASLRPGESISS
jgi:hypothetical protein